jgi:NAD+ kinase
LPEKPPFKSISLLPKSDDREADGITKVILKALTESGFEAVRVDHANDTKADLIITVGGDGTILRAVRETKGKVPVLGVNVGGRGILAELKPQQLDLLIDQLRTQKLYLQRRLRLGVRVGRERTDDALNDIFIGRRKFTETPQFAVSSKGKPWFKGRMDGLVIATSTGSTGHSYSAGGPVLKEDSRNMVLTPINPINMLPSVVVPATELSVTVASSSEIVIDGQKSFPVAPKRPIIVNPARQDATFVRLSKIPFHQLGNLGFA